MKDINYIFLAGLSANSVPAEQNGLGKKWAHPKSKSGADQRPCNRNFAVDHQKIHGDILKRNAGSVHFCITSTTRFSCSSTEVSACNLSLLQ